MVFIEMPTLLVVIFVLFVTLAVAVSVPLGHREIPTKQENCQRAAEYPFCRFHFMLRPSDLMSLSSR